MLQYMHNGVVEKAIMGGKWTFACAIQYAGKWVKFQTTLALPNSTYPKALKG